MLKTLQIVYRLIMYRKFLATSLLFPFALGGATTAFADAWVLEPSIKFDIGYDDNNGMDVTDPQRVGVTKVTGELMLRRLSETHYFRGGLLADAVAYSGDESIDPNSNQVAYFSTTFKRPRSSWGANFRYRRDSLLREAVANSDEIIQVEENQDASVDQFLDVTRQRLYLKPFYNYNLTRLMSFGMDYQLSTVDHDKGESEAVDVQDYTNQGVNFRLDKQITPLDKVIGTVGHSFYTTDVDTNETEYRTNYLRLGYERSLSPTFTVGGDIGYRVTEFNESQEDIKKDGPIGSVSAVKTTGLTKFELRAGLELYPSSIGQVVQTQELVGNVTRNLSELMVFSLQSRFYQNTALSGNDTVFIAGENATADNDRRSMTIRPEFRWQVAREWVVGAAYAYRREKLESKPAP
ncbi:MAG: hypothetical protein KDJ38_12595, partial [Gammaproteobacteria bacterium]|nr:hypothetical protein [Gammaproteobacteria bacterium]